MSNSKGVVLPFLGGTCGLSGDSCGRAELPRRDADEPLEVTGELALVREAGPRGDLRQGEVVALQELLGPLDAAGDDVLIGRQPGGRLELPREVIGAQAGHRRHLPKGRAGVEVVLDVRDDGAEPPPRQVAVPPARRPAGCRDVADQVDGQEAGQIWKARSDLVR